MRQQLDDQSRRVEQPEMDTNTAILEQLYAVFSFFVVIGILAVMGGLIGTTIAGLMDLVKSDKMTVQEMKEVVPMLVGGGGIGSAVLGVGFLWFRNWRVRGRR